MCYSDNDTVGVLYVVMAVPLQVLVCVCGLLYTHVVMVPLHFGITTVSRKGIEPTDYLSSTVNVMGLSML